MAEVHVPKEDIHHHVDLDIEAIERSTGRTVTDIWLESTWADGVPPELEKHVY